MEAVTVKLLERGMNMNIDLLVKPTTQDKERILGFVDCRIKGEYDVLSYEIKERMVYMLLDYKDEGKLEVIVGVTESGKIKLIAMV